ncbi:unnamed protein product [Allacma fusca]|uniref:Uncharacterized protein n=1 Tax=Allacma fusca TaxID=39272 RepID=A0A8J2P936_9HEXA|nr:unnamed protein product [Allacma fusca]
MVKSETPATFFRVDTTIKKLLKKRRLDTSFDEVSDKIIKFLDTPEPVPAAEDHSTCLVEASPIDYGKCHHLLRPIPGLHSRKYFMRPNSQLNGLV